MHTYKYLNLVMFFLGKISFLQKNTSTLPDLLSMPMLTINLCCLQIILSVQSVCLYTSPSWENTVIIIAGIHIKTVRGSHQTLMKTLPSPTRFGQNTLPPVQEDGSWGFYYFPHLGKANTDLNPGPAHDMNHQKQANNEKPGLWVCHSETTLLEGALGSQSQGHSWQP